MLLNINQPKLRKAESNLQTHRSKRKTQMFGHYHNQSYQIQDVKRITGSQICFLDNTCIPLQDIYSVIEGAPLTRKQQKRWKNFSRTKKNQVVQKMIQTGELAISKPIDTKIENRKATFSYQHIGKEGKTDNRQELKWHQNQIRRSAKMRKRKEGTGKQTQLEVSMEEGVPEPFTSNMQPVNDLTTTLRQNNKSDVIKEVTQTGGIGKKDIYQGKGQKREGIQISQAAITVSEQEKVVVTGASSLNPTMAEQIGSIGRGIAISIRGFTTLTECINAENKENQIKQVAVRKMKRELYQKASAPAKSWLMGAASNTKNKVFLEIQKGLSAVWKGIQTALAPILTALAPVLLLIIIIIILVLGIGSSTGNAHAKVSAACERYRPLVQQYATQYGIPEYVELILAVMMQESGGNHIDVMQAAEGAFNTKYPKVPNGITDPEYSIECGVQEVKHAMELAGVTSPTDMEHIKLALQGYNFGSAYIGWAINKDGGYTPENAAEYSAMMVSRPGWGYSRYGDIEYVPHVLRYYVFTSSIIGGDAIGSQVAQLALSKVGCSYSKDNRLGENTYDCSSLVFRLYQEAGIDYLYGKTAAEEAKYLEEHGMTVSEEELQPGDVIFYGGKNNGRYRGIYHVAIYVGDGMQVDARNSKYGVVHRSLDPSNIGLYARPR